MARAGTAVFLIIGLAGDCQWGEHCCPLAQQTTNLNCSETCNYIILRSDLNVEEQARHYYYYFASSFVQIVGPNIGISSLES